MFSILRDDMTPDAQAHVNAILDETLACVTDYTADFSLQVKKLMLLFRHHTFQLNQGSVTFPLTASLDPNALLPVGFLPNGVRLPLP
ncbi:hypothetical protein MAM1_0517c10814 [Mucor ambiguus]|uniref:Uncharacterized protein n=1 Tax=Mucor ambiguus TaxID=91626 RepID=A0A0C9LYR4_9FUNG|nr:hypothetical protein MAM1_0517c10814 [Mucor ambiguus]